ncbi:MAG: hypothetical protein AAF748_15120 [Pseudomonadota bacterium]
MHCLRLTKPLIGIACFLAVSACGSMTPAGLIAASRLDPLNTPPGDIAVGVGVPETVLLSDGDAQFQLAFRVDPNSPVAAVEETVPLQLRRAEDSTSLANAPDEIVYEARFSAEDAGRIAAAQSEIRKLRADGVDGSGSISITLSGGCYTGAPLSTLPFSTWLKTKPDGRFAPLTRRVDVFRALDDESAALLVENLRPCGAP